jgi:hypothetical protein
MNEWTGDPKEEYIKEIEKLLIHTSYGIEKELKYFKPFKLDAKYDVSKN